MLLPRSKLRTWLKGRVPDLLVIGARSLRDYRRHHGAYPNLLRPRSLSEKMQWRKLFDRRPLLATFADKLAVRAYAAERIGHAHLTGLYHVTADPTDVPLDRLPDRFVVKPTHGSGWVYLVRDKSRLDLDDFVRTARFWLGQNYFYGTGEWVYKHIPPRLIFEEFIEDGASDTPNDYKFFMFGGRAAFVQVDVGRYQDHRRNLYDLNWNRLPFEYEYPGADQDVPRPARLDEMIRCAELLSAGFDFLRVDLYCTAERVIFGEITTTPENGLGRFTPASYDRLYGDLWQMDVPPPWSRRGGGRPGRVAAPIALDGGSATRQSSTRQSSRS